MIIQLAQEKKSLKIVDDQWGSPTSAKTLSESIQTIIHYLEQKKNFMSYGTYHVTSDGETNWYLYARKILETLEALGIELKLKKNNLHSISSSNYPQDAMRPKNSTLNTKKYMSTFMVKLPHWEKEVQDTISQIIKDSNN
jgi:dTDP-4-dehydrorhamnose reductase